jgi:hypothetical protein
MRAEYSSVFGDLKVVESLTATIPFHPVSPTAWQNKFARPPLHSEYTTCWRRSAPLTHRRTELVLGPAPAPCRARWRNAVTVDAVEINPDMAAVRTHVAPESGWTAYIGDARTLSAAGG